MKVGLKLWKFIKWLGEHWKQRSFQVSWMCVVATGCLDIKCISNYNWLQWRLFPLSMVWESSWKLFLENFSIGDLMCEPRTHDTLCKFNITYCITSFWVVGIWVECVSNYELPIVTIVLFSPAYRWCTTSKSIIICRPHPAFRYLQYGSWVGRAWKRGLSKWTPPQVC